jgi:spore coat protein U-like protein
MQLKSRHVLAAAAMLGIVGVAGAATKTDTFQVTVNVPQNCLVTATDLDFGTYTPGGGDVPGQSQVQVACTDTLAYTVNLDGGLGGSFAPRTMTRLGGGTLQYNLYTEVAHTNVWGDGTGGTANTPGVGTGLGNFAAYQVYGLIPDSGATNLNSAEGDYADTVTVSVVY